jgi:hypothetical protein
MKTQIISLIVAASIIPFLTGCEKTYAATAAPEQMPTYTYKIIRVTTIGGNTFLDSMVEKGWEPISLGGGEGLGHGQTAVLLRKEK